MQSPNEDKFRLASYMLRDSATQWFDNKLRLKGEDTFQTWDQFKEAFYAKYFPLSRRTQMEKQFLSLRQRAMSVKEYEAQFDRLSQFALSLVIDEKSRSRHFAEGLKYYIRRAIVPFMRNILFEDSRYCQEPRGYLAGDIRPIYAIGHSQQGISRAGRGRCLWQTSLLPLLARQTVVGSDSGSSPCFDIRGRSGIL